MISPLMGFVGLSVLLGEGVIGSMGLWERPSSFSLCWDELVVRVQQSPSNPSPWFVLVFISPLKGFSGLSDFGRERDIGVLGRWEWVGVSCGVLGRWFGLETVGKRVGLILAGTGGTVLWIAGLNEMFGEEYDDQSDDVANKEKTDKEAAKKIELLAELKAIETILEKKAKDAAKNEGNNAYYSSGKPQRTAVVVPGGPR
ncbi:hypothetical protein Tco_0397075 [Tanacetum coccineum]